MTASQSSASHHLCNSKKCIDCPLPVSDGRSRCGKCFASHKLYNKEYGAKYREKNREKLREYKAKYNKERVQGPPLSKAARERKTELARKRKRERVADGLCAECSSPQLEHSGSLCLRHWARGIASRGLRRSTLKVADALLEKLEGQQWKCPYTGTTLVPAKNCELDHILPVSRFPGLRSSVDNVEWVSRRINRLKSARTKEEFIAFCRLVASYTWNEVIAAMTRDEFSTSGPS